MNKTMGAVNSRGFSSSIQSGRLPASTHLTYEGVFNELKYDVGKTNKAVDLHFGYARYQFPHSAYDTGMNDFLAIFLKGESDGKDRDSRRLNSIICLDISGSMGGPLGNINQGKDETRLALSLQAMKMFISKLRPDDSVGIVVFDTSAKTILRLTLKKDLSNSVYSDLDAIQCGGGTTIRYGFERSVEEMQSWIKDNHSQNCENRIIMLTDVNDNSISGQKAFIEMASRESNINLTIIGISHQFQSNVCQVLKDIRGFNYFCAVNNSDIKKFVFETFDFNFFPSVYNIEIDISSKDISSFEVFGVPDSDKVNEYNGDFSVPRERYITTKVKSSFPSDIEIHGDRILVQGGLILLKLKRHSKDPEFKANINVSFETPSGSKQNEAFQIGFQFHKEEQFFSFESLREAIEGFIFVSQLKHLLQDSQTKDQMYIYDKYWRTLQQLQRFTPKSKQQDLKNIKMIVQKMRAGKDNVAE